MKVIGLTGSIGMGKSTTAGFFAEAGIPVHDSDRAVHDLYRGEAVPAIAAIFSGVVRDGLVDREALSAALRSNPAKFTDLEAIVHPLVRQHEARFLEAARVNGADLAVLDIPLLFETGAEKRVDVVVVASCDPAIQRSRVMSRPGMTEEKFALIRARQTPDAEKRRRADFIVDTGQGFEAARSEVASIIERLRGGWKKEQDNA